MKIAMKNETIKDVVKTRQLLIYDKNDKLKIIAESYFGDPKISFLKQDGTPALEIYSGSKNNSRSIIFFQEKHKMRIIITSGDTGAGIEIFDKNENLCGTIGIISESELK